MVTNGGRSVMVEPLAGVMEGVRIGSGGIKVGRLSGWFSEVAEIEGPSSSAAFIARFSAGVRHVGAGSTTATGPDEC